MGYRLVRRKIRKNWDQVSLTDDIYSLDFPIDRWIVAIPVQWIGSFVHCQTKFPPVSTLATPSRNHSHQTVAPPLQNDVYPARSTGHVILGRRIAPDGSLTWLPCVENSDAAKFLYASLADENQMYQLIVHIDSKHRHHGLTHTFVRALFYHWNRVSCVPNHPHDYRNPFWCPSKCQIFAESADYRTDQDLGCISIYPAIH